MPIPVGSSSSTSTAYPGDFSGVLNGLPFGVGTAYRTANVSGWRDMNAAPNGGLSQLQPRGQRNGSYPVPYFMPSRVVTLQFNVEELPGDSFESALAALEAATLPGVGDIALTMQVGGVDSTVYGSVSARIIPTGLEVLAGFTLAQIEVTCDDPRRFGASLSTGAIHLPSSTGGLTWPITWPLAWSSTSVTGSAVLTSGGNTDGPVTYRIDGPVTGPQIVHVESGLQLAFSDALTVAAGDWLDIDCEARTVLYNGQSSRNAFLTRRGWHALTPGVNTFFFNASSYSTVATLSVTATPASI